MAGGSVTFSISGRIYSHIYQKTTASRVWLVPVRRGYSEAGVRTAAHYDNEFCS